MEAMGQDLPEERKENKLERNKKRGRMEWRIFSKRKYRKKNPKDQKGFRGKQIKKKRIVLLTGSYA